MSNPSARPEGQKTVVVVYGDSLTPRPPGELGGSVLALAKPITTMKYATRYALLCLILSSSVFAEKTSVKLEEVPAYLRIPLMAIDGNGDDPVPPLKNAVKVGEIRAKEVVLMGRRYTIGQCSMDRGQNLLLLQIITVLTADGLYAIHLSIPLENGRPSKAATISMFWVQKGAPDEPEDKDNPAGFIILMPQ